MFDRIFAGKYQGTFLAWDLDLDPDLFSLFHSSQIPQAGQNFAFYSNKEVDRLIDAGRLEMDDTKRKEIYHQLHAILAEEQPYMWTFQVSTKWGLRHRVRNVEESDGLGLFLWYPSSLQWWLGEQRLGGNSVAVPR
jgi:peptide/nickel transport system substrate-binding protein